MDQTDTPEVRILPTGQSIEGGDYLFEGSSDEGRDYLRALSEDQRAAVTVWTPGHIFTVAQFEAEIPHHEHDPIRPA